MGAKAGSIGSIVLGVVMVVVGAVTSYAGGSGVGLIISGVAMIAGGAIGLAFSPKGLSRETARSQDLQVSTAADGIPLPVVFGEVRVVTNFMNYALSTFRASRVVGRSDGSKGGDASPANVIGYDYYLTYEAGICMGPIDEIAAVFNAPGEKSMMGGGALPIVYGSTEDTKEIVLDSVDPTNGGGAESGLVRVYKGSRTQTRLTTSDPYNFSATLQSGSIRKGYQYKIASHSIVDFTVYGASSNAVGTLFVATSSSGSILTSVDSVIEYTGLNYRSVCWALFMDFRIGRFPQPKSYHFVVRRRPAHSTGDEMLRPDGTTITDFRVRGSSDPLRPAYNQANPAAILYEILTDRTWGRGLDQSMFDEASWISVSQYFHDRHIGMSFIIDTQDKLSTILDGIRSQVKTILTWDGNKLKLRCLLDLSTTHGKIQTITKAEARYIRPTRPMWSATTNEVRAEYNSAWKNWRTDAVHVRDHGNYQLTGRINSTRVNFNGFTDLNTVRRQAIRLLREQSYPLTTYEISINRFKSQVEVGDVVRLLWDEYGGDATVYLLVVRVEDSDSDADEMKITAIEDITLRPASGTEATPTPPTIHPWEKVPDINESEYQLWDGSIPAPPTGKQAGVLELPAILERIAYSPLEGVVVQFGEQPSASYSAHYSFYAKQVGTPNPFVLSKWVPTKFVIGGLISSTFPLFKYIDRGTTGFSFTLDDPTLDEALLLSTFSSVDLPTDDIEDILLFDGPVMIIGEEWFKLGKVEKLGTNSYRARNIVRGMYGSRRSPHAIGDRIWFCPALPPTTETRVELTANTLYKFKGTAQSLTGQAPVPYNNDTPYFIPHIDRLGDYTVLDQRYMREGQSPLAPVLYDFKTDPLDSTKWMVRFRPRFSTVGAGTGSLADALIQYVTTLTQTFTLHYQKRAGGGFGETYQQIPMYGALYPNPTYSPGCLGDPLCGLVTIKFFKQSFINTQGRNVPLQMREADGTLRGPLTPDSIVIRSVENGLSSIGELRININ